MLKVGIVGIGFMGMIHYLAYQRIPGVKVTAICEQIPERLKGDWTKIKGNFGPAGTQMDLTGVATYSNLDDMLKNPELDVIDICLPPNGHAPAAIAAVNAGKHVFCEKPISLKPEEGIEMVAEAQKNGKMIMIGHVLPFFPSHGFIYDAKISGKYGKLLGGSFIRMNAEPFWLTHFFEMDKAGGPLLDLHVHDAHFIRCLFGMPKAVHSVGHCRANGVPDYFNSQFLFDDPQIMVTAASGSLPQQGRQFTHGYEVYFEKATVLYESFMGMPVTVLTEDGNVEHPEIPNLDDIQVFANELTEATNAFQNNQVSPMLDGILARDALVLCHKELESIHKRAQVQI